VLVRGDEDKLRQVLINLLGNATKFTERGEVCLRVVSPQDDHYQFEVIDTGPGMSDEEQASLFEAFQQGAAGLKRGGTGLGLTISQRHLALMGSKLEVESELGKGSCLGFTVCLPPAQSDVQSRDEQDWSRVIGLASGYKVKALVADDVMENREILCRMLNDIGVEVAQVENGRQALERMERVRPDIVFMDIRMPVMDGVEAVRLIQENKAFEQVKVVAISASALEHEREEFLQGGFEDFIDKPFRFERICARMAEHLNVEYAYEKDDKEAVNESESVDWSKITLPEDLHTRLQEAAELYSVTELENCCDEMATLGELPAKLSVHFRELRRKYDIGSILSILQEISHQ